MFEASVHDVVIRIDAGAIKFLLIAGEVHLIELVKRSIHRVSDHVQLIHGDGSAYVVNNLDHAVIGAIRRDGGERG